MILTCPSCDVHYFADEASIGAEGKRVRCAACGHSWVIEGAGGRDVPAASPGSAHEAFRERIREQRLRLTRRVAASSWLISTGVFALVLLGAVFARDPIVRAWPQSAPAYKLLGFDVNRFGLEFINHEARRTFDGTTPVLSIRGEAENITTVRVEAPLVLVLLRDEQGLEVARAVTTVEPGEIAPGQQGRFLAVLTDPPIEAFDLELSFLPPGAATPARPASHPSEATLSVSDGSVRETPAR